MPQIMNKSRTTQRVSCGKSLIFRRVMKLNITVEKIGDVETTPDFWDCECVQNYIHLKKQSICGICKAIADEQPDSRIDEIANSHRGN